MDAVDNEDNEEEEIGDAHRRYATTHSKTSSGIKRRPVLNNNSNKKDM